MSGVGENVARNESKITIGRPLFNTEESPKGSALNLKEMEKLYIELAMKCTANNKTEAAELLGPACKTLLEKARKYGLDDSNEN